MLQYVDGIKKLLIFDGYLDLDNLPSDRKILKTPAYVDVEMSTWIIDVPFTCRRLYNDYLKDFLVFEDTSNNDIYIGIY